MALEGYIIKPDNTVKHGFIGVKAPASYSEHVLFKSSEQGTFDRYTPEQLKAFGFDSGEKFESLPVNDERRFLKVLVDGKLDLLQLQQAGSILFYSRLEDELPTLLFYKETLIDKRYRHKNEYYKHQLKEQMSDRPDIHADIDEIKSYTAEPLMEVFTKYNEAIHPGAIAISQESADSVRSTGNSASSKLTGPASWSMGGFVGKAFSNPGFFMVGVTAELEGRNRIFFTSFNLQTGAVKKRHQVSGHGSFSSSHTITQVGAKINFVIVPLSGVRPYVSLVVNGVRYQNSISIDETEAISMWALAMGGGLGVKFKMNNRVSFKTELELHLIPGAEPLADDSAIYLFNPQYAIANKPLNSFNFGFMYSLR